MHWTYANDDTPAYLSVKRDSNFNVVSHNTVKFQIGDSKGNVIDTLTFLYGKDFNTIADLVCAFNAKAQQDSYDVTLSFDATTGTFVEHDGKNSVQDASAFDDSASATSTGPVANVDSLLKGLNGAGTQSDPFMKKDTYYFHDIQDLVNIWQMAIDDSNDPTGNQNAVNNVKAKVGINSDGKITVTNISGQSFNISVSGYPQDQDNQLFTEAFSPINGTVANGGVAASQAINAAVHVTSMDIFDSLGAKHTITFHFRKTHTSEVPADPTVWKWYADVPAPSTIDNPAYGDVKFNPDGSLKAVNPPSIIFNPKNGANPGQAIHLNFGTINGFDGITSFEAPSSTSGQTQDGYPGGDLEQLVVDQTGTIIGVFTNGRSYSLAQVAIAKFVNNEGLMSEGGTLFAASPNSGDPIIGTAGTGGRGSIQPSSLEMSNVDLSRALTQLIVIQRGFQANSKTITTSDQMLNTLLQLKQ
jgi:flagellar hook protein FlgE